jgi:hypothetical protein
MKLRKSTFLLSIYDGGVIDTYALEVLYAALFHLVWADVFNDANCSIIIRTKVIQEATGLAGSFTSDLIKIN